MGAIDGPALASYREHLLTLVDSGKLAPYSARDRLADAKQFVRWAWELELLELPRILESKSFAIAVTAPVVETFTSEEIRELLVASSETTKLYLLLMLNCGMQQGDIAELRQDEVNWETGRLTRQRSKTRKHNADKVPTVSYQLWPETFASYSSNTAARTPT